MKLIYFLIILLFAMAMFVANGSYAEVRDGDTIVIGGIPVRLEGLHCPELGAEGGQLAKEYASDIVEQSQMTCQLSGKKSYDREIGYCQADGFDFGRLMIQSGLCQPCRRYDRLKKYNDISVTATVPAYCK